MKKLLSIMLLSGALALSGCGNDNDFVFTNNNTPQIAAPVCAADAYTTSANTTLTVNAATGVLANDTPNGATLAFQATSANGGTITGAADGSFTYSPAANFFGADTFTYTLANSGGAVTCTVTITVNAVNGFFVDAATGNDGTGSFTNGVPFATVQAAVAAAGTGQDIVVRPGSYTGTVTLKNGQRLLGSGSVLAQGVVRPTLTGPIDMADGNTVDFIRVSGTAGDAINGDGQNGGIVTNCEFANITNSGNAFQGNGIRGAWVISSNTLVGLPGIGILLQTLNADTLTLRVENNSITNTQGALGLAVDSTSNVKSRITGNTMTGSSGVGSSMEFAVDQNATLCIDMENNSNDQAYLFTLLDGGTGALQVEQLSVLTTAQPAGAGNTGTVNITSTAGFKMPTEVSNGFCVF